MAEFLADLHGYWEMIRFPLGALLCLGGSILCVIGTVGVLRFPDIYTRLYMNSGM